MTSKRQVTVKVLDIWNIVEKHISIHPDWAIDESTLYLNKTYTSFVDVYYFDISKMTLENINEEPKVKRFDLTLEDTNNMYRDIIQMVDMPPGVYELHVHLKQGVVVEFNVKFVPFKK